MTIHLTSIDGPFTPISSVRQIEKTVAQTFAIDVDYLKGHSRKFARARQTLMYLLYRHTDMSYPEIGRSLRRDHTTVMHGVHLIESMLEVGTHDMPAIIGEIEVTLKEKGYIV